MSSLSSRLFNWSAQKTKAPAARCPVEESLQVTVQASIQTDARPAIPVAVASLPVPIPPLATPPAVHYSSVETREDMVADFFGARPARTQERLAAPPPYSQQMGSEQPPSYPGHSSDEPASLARFLFLYGFFFPLFWIVGSLILCLPLETTPDWESGKTEEERKQLLSEIRANEIKWGRRCLWALLALLSMVAAVVLAVCLPRRF